MAQYRVIKTGFSDGIWRGRLEAEGRAGAAPEIVVTRDGRAVPGLRLAETAAPGAWTLEIPVPAAALCDGVQSFVIALAGEAAPLASFSVIAGDAAEADLRAEIALLRAELDLVKRALRRLAARQPGPAGNAAD
ncbi:hypothetical protein [Roseivivax sp. CAU 1761]